MSSPATAPTDTHPLEDKWPLTTTGRVWAILAIVEGTSWCGLLFGMLVKYVFMWTGIFVTVFGTIHGMLFVAYLPATIAAAFLLRWGWWRSVLAVFASIPPLATFPLERWFERTGYLSHPSARLTQR